MRDEIAFGGTPASDRAGGPILGRTRQHPGKRLPVLDGWRAISILLVLGAHLLPLGPHWMQLNEVAAAAGMALFFTLSGFLITQFLASGIPISDFLARRLARILPLGWLAVSVLILWRGSDVASALRNYLFVANLPPAALLHGGEHLWSLCVEMQFYASIALICALLGRRGLYLIPALALLVTLIRILTGAHISIITWQRIDEILAGGIIALIYSGRLGRWAENFLQDLPVYPLAIALLVCSHPDAGSFQYLRPYAGSLLVGATLTNCPKRLRQLLESLPMAYIAEISYALYVIHGVLSATWLGAGDKTVKYLKRPLLFLATFALAHCSTRYFEQPITRSVRQWTKKRREKRRLTRTPSISAASRLSE